MNANVTKRECLDWMYEHKFPASYNKEIMPSLGNRFLVQLQSNNQTGQDA